jgi:anti-sigma regulatory factor (Ser/Thr protein kinase)
MLYRFKTDLPIMITGKCFIITKSKGAASQVPPQVISIPDCLREIFAFERLLQMQDVLLSNSGGSLSFADLRFIEPYSMIGLLLLGRNYLRTTGDKLLISDIPLPIHQYLSRMDFFKKGVYLEEKPLEPDKHLSRSAESRRIVEITDIPNKERDSIKAISSTVSLFRKRGSHILKFFITDNIADMLVTAISELCQNVFEHSTDSGYFTAQAYELERAHIVRLVIADSGIGIEESFASKRESVTEKGAELIQKALTTPISGKRVFGYGLCQVNSIVGRLEGNLFIRSGQSSVAVVNKGMRRGSFLKDGLPHFQGTQISMTLSSE